MVIKESWTGGWLEYNKVSVMEEGGCEVDSRCKDSPGWVLLGLGCCMLRKGGGTHGYLLAVLHSELETQRMSVS